MIRQLKPIGTYSEKKAKKYLKLGLLFLIPFVFLFLTSIPRLPFYIDMGRYETNRGSLMGVFFTLGAIFIMLPYRTWKSGLTGERNVVKNISDKLGSNYSLFNDVLLTDGKRGNIDQMIVGPTGIYVIETKNNQGTVTYDGHKWKGISRDPSQQAVFNSVRIRDILKDCEVFKNRKPYVNPVVLFTNSKINPKVSEDPKYCKVLQIKKLTDTNLSEYVRSGPIRFSNEEIASIEQSLRTRIGN
jgi:hypothetical protein